MAKYTLLLIILGILIIGSIRLWKLNQNKKVGLNYPKILWWSELRYDEVLEADLTDWVDEGTEND